MKNIKILFLLLLFVLIPCLIYAANITGKSIYKVGEYVDITFNFGTNVAAYDSITVSYDTTMLQYVSGDSLTETLWWDTTESSKGISTKTYRFKALKKGTTSVSVSIKGAVSANKNMDRLGNISSSKPIVIGDNILEGDLNKDKIVDSTDAAIILTLYKNNSATLEQIAIGDANGDGVLDSVDTAIILTRYKSN